MMTTEYKLYCTEIGSLELVRNSDLYFKITVDYFLRNFHIKNYLNQACYQGKLKGWFFMERLVSRIDENTIFTFKKNKLINSNRNVEYRQTLGDRLKINMEGYQIDIFELDGMKALRWSGELSNEDIFLITCIVIYIYVLKFSHRSFEYFSSKSYE